MPKQPTEIEIDISTLSTGSGVIHNERRWVRNALPGETVRARILDDGAVSGLPMVSRWRISAPTGYRLPVRIFLAVVVAHPPHSARGAVSAQTTQLADQVDAQGIAPNSWREPVTCCAWAIDARRAWVFGWRLCWLARESFSNRVARIDACATLTPELSKLINPLKACIAKTSDAKTIPQIELAQGGPAVRLLFSIYGFNRRHCVMARV